MRLLTAATAALVAVALGGLADTALAQPKVPPGYKAAPIEVAQLPPYCYAQYVDGAYFGHPVYSIPAACGPYTNHFCPALVSLIRGSNASRARSLRREDLRHAAMEVRYTLRYMKPDCPIYNDVQAAKIRAESLQKIVQ